MSFPSVCPVRTAHHVANDVGRQLPDGFQVQHCELAHNLRLRKPMLQFAAFRTVGP